MTNVTHIDDTTTAAPSLRGVALRVEWLNAKITDLLSPFALLALRLPVAVVFWRSGRTRV